MLTSGQGVLKRIVIRVHMQDGQCGMAVIVAFF